MHRALSIPRLLLLAAFLLAAMLLILGSSGLSRAHDVAREASARAATDRALALQSALRRLGPAAPSAVRAILSDLQPAGGYARVVESSGVLWVSTREDEAPGQRFTVPEPAPGEVVQVAAPAEGTVEAWVHPPFGRRGSSGAAGAPHRAGPPGHPPRSSDPERPPGGGHAHRPAGGPPGGDHALSRGRRLVVGIPTALYTAGIRAARLQLGASGLTALLMLALAGFAAWAWRQTVALQIRVARQERLAALGALGAVMAHEIRTPVAAVRGYAQLVGERIDPGDERLARPAAGIVRESDRLAHLISGLLAYARPAPPVFEPIDLASVAQDAAERLAPRAAEAGVRLLVEAEGAVTLPADEGRLAQLVANLIHNGIQASPEGEAVVIRVSQDRRSGLVEVLDRGPGVPEAERELIFEPFHTGEAQGTGLGLAIGRRIADEHGGTLWVEARVGGGAVFRLSLPRRPR